MISRVSNVNKKMSKQILLENLIWFYKNSNNSCVLWLLASLFFKEYHWFYSPKFL